MNDDADNNSPSERLARPTIQNETRQKGDEDTQADSGQCRAGDLRPGATGATRAPPGPDQSAKRPPNFQGNQKAKGTAAKGLLPHRDHRRTRICRSHKGLLTEGPRAAGATGAPTATGTNRRSPEDQGAKGSSQGPLPTRWGLGPKTRCPGTPRARSRDYAQNVTSLCHVTLRPGRSSFQKRTIQTNIASL